MRVIMRRTAVLFFCVAGLGCAGPPVSFQKQIRPILARNCQGCHQPASRQSGLSLVTFQDMQTGGRKGAAFMAGNPEKSVIISYLTGETKPQMPFGGTPLPADQIELISRWIREGAVNDSTAEPAEAVPAGPVVYHAPPVITALAISPDGQTMAISGYREILLHKIGGGLIGRLPGLSERIHSLVFTPDGRTLAAVGGSPARFGEVQIWDAGAQKLKHSVVITNDTLFGASLSPDGTKLAFGCADKSVRIFDVAAGKEIRKMDHHEDWVFGTVFGVDGRRLVSAGRDRAAKITDVASGAFIENVNLLKEGLSAVARHPKKDWVLIGGQERIPYLYMMDRPRAMRIADDSTLIRKFEAQDGSILALTISPDGSRMAVGSEAGDVRIYNLDTGELVGRCTGHVGGIYALQFYPDTSRLVTAGFDGNVRIYDLTGKLDHSFVPVTVDKVTVSQVNR
jgi:WD40 repeat protein